MKTADWSIVKEASGPFVAGVFAFLLIQCGAVVMNLLRFAALGGSGVEQALRVMAFRTPQFVVYALPISVLFGVSLGINRMARENEITVLRLAGLPLRRIAVPLALAAALVGVLSFLLSETVTPRMNQRAAEEEYRLLFKVRPVAVRADVFFTAGPYKFYIGDMRRTDKSGDPDKAVFVLYRVMVYEMRPGAFPVLITANSARAEGTKWTLYQGVRRELDQRGFTTNELQFPKYEFDVDRSAGTLWSVAQSSEEMTARDLKRAITAAEQTGRANDVRSWQVDYYLKFALPFAGVALALVCFPLAVRFGRSGSFAGMIIGLGAFFVYMQSYLLCKELGERFAPPLAAAWIPNIALLILGLVLIRVEE
ncbi:MAG: YjgP/YjgQ family permease [Armatimonadetes bacterium]|jgi:LPS export ABC transporter permease LptG|nr:YjgP/YjgQ family permease [Armatimonadota bacterium]HOC31409.1 LptF/LptG family permease [Armatimonadota bacterium]